MASGEAVSSSNSAVGVLTELRVHGVSGTPPEALLRLPKELIERVAGDEAAGFYKPRLPSAGWASGEVDENPESGDRTGEVPNGPVLRRAAEAYSWGGLTSGPAPRALWLLFLPFILINLAHWMLPPALEKPGSRSEDEPKPSRAAIESVRLLRLIGLSLTVTMLLALAVVAMDLVGWQCAALDYCGSRLGPAAVLEGRSAGVRIAWTAVPPLVLIFVLWFLGREDPRKIRDAPPPDAAVTTSQSPLTLGRFWHGDESVRRLRSCHVTGWASVLALLTLAAPTRYALNWGIRGVCIGLVVLHGLAFVTVVVATCSNRATARGGESVPSWVTRRLSQLRWASLLMLIGTLLWVGCAPADYQLDPFTPTHLPGLQPAIYALLGLQPVLLVALFLCTAASMHGWRGVGRWRLWPIGRVPGRQPAAVPATRDPDFTATLRGFAAPFVATIAWLIGGGFSIGVGLFTARYLGHPVRATADARDEFLSRKTTLESDSAPFQDQIDAFNQTAPLIVPPPYFWSAAATTVVILIAIAVTAAVVFWLIPKRARADTEADSVAADVADRFKAVARARAWASLTESAVRIAAVLTVITLVVMAILFGLYVSRMGLNFLPTLVPGFTNASVFITAALAAVLVGLAILAFRDRETRRVVAVLWDVVTFWPRANHPLTPPCYGEQAVPELRLHVTLLSTDDPPTNNHPMQKRVIIAAHSQGTIIAVAALLQAQTSDHVALLTFGCPLRRLYARNFPAYFGYGVLSALRDSQRPRWINLWARSDPIGSFIFSEQNRSWTEALHEVDYLLPDTTSFKRNLDDTYPPICGHSGFWIRPEYTDAITALEITLLPEPTAAVQGPSLPRPYELAV
jgi:hypothetical protein